MKSNLSVNDFLFSYFPELPRHEIFDRLSTLEQEYFPHLSWQQAQEQVVWKIVQRHQDHRLNYFWAMTKNQISTQKVAA